METTESKSALVKIDPVQYGIPESKAKELEIVFAPFIDLLKTIEEKRNALLNKPITKVICDQAHDVRMEAVKFRTSIDKAHKKAKEESRKTGLAIDGWKNLLINASSPIEVDTQKIEKHFENLEIERINKLQTERVALILPYSPESAKLELGKMPEAVWETFLKGTKVDFEEREKKKVKAARFIIRKKQMIDLGFNYNENREYQFSLEGIWSCFQEQIEEPEDNDFNIYVEAIKTAIAEHESKKVTPDPVSTVVNTEPEEKRIEAMGTFVPSTEVKPTSEKMPVVKTGKENDKEMLEKWIDEVNIGAFKVLTQEGFTAGKLITEKFNEWKTWAKLRAKNM